MTQVQFSAGDLARWLPDGTIEFLGRIDFQVPFHLLQQHCK